MAALISSAGRGAEPGHEGVEPLDEGADREGDGQAGATEEILLTCERLGPHLRLFLVHRLKSPSASSTLRSHQKGITKNGEGLHACVAAGGGRESSSSVVYLL